MEQKYIIAKYTDRTFTLG